jgi:hypothetical protein
MEQMYLDGKSDILVSDIPAREFEAAGTFIPLFRAHLGFIMLRRADMPTMANEVLADRRLRIHYVRSAITSTFSGFGKEVDAFLEPLAKESRLGTYKDLEEGIKKLRAHHIDAMFDVPYLVEYIREFDKTLDPVYIPTSPTWVDGWYVSNKTAPGIDRDLLAQLIAEYARSNVYLKAMNRGISNREYYYSLIEQTSK